MKKVIPTLLLLVLILVACSGEGNKSELEQFSDEYNKRASNEGIAKLNPDEFEEIETEDGGVRGWQTLYETNGYSIDAKYEDGKNLSGYYLVIDTSEPFEEYEGDGYRAGVTIAKALGLNAGDYVKGFSTAIREGSFNYTEDNYLISFTYPGADGLTSAGMIINFDKR